MSVAPASFSTLDAPSDAATVGLLVDRLEVVQRLSAGLAAEQDLDAHLRALTTATLELTGFRCGQVYTFDAGHWGVHAGPHGPDRSACTVDDAIDGFATFGDETVVIDRTGPHRDVLAGRPSTLAKALVTPIRVGLDQPTILVLRTDDPELVIDRLTIELVHMLTTNGAIAIEHARAHAAEREQLAQLRENRARNIEFVQLLSHDLRNPLATITGVASLLLDHQAEIDHDQADAILETISSEGHRLSRLVEDVAVAVLGDHDELAITPEPIAVHQLMKAEITLAHAGVAEWAINLDVDPSIVVFADHDRALQIVQNLVDNAQKHGDAAEPVRLRTHALAGWAAIDVSNGGPPIPTSVRNVLFDKFQRGSAIGEGPSGDGLGLYIARRFARAMGGDVVLLDDETTTFRLTLPLVGGLHRSIDPTVDLADATHLRLVV